MILTVIYDKLFSYLLVNFFTLIQSSETSLEITEFVVPREVIMGSEVQLICKYFLGDNFLYSFKWYKNEKEFYHFVPSNAVPIKIFLIEGIQIDTFRSDLHKLVLLNVTRSTSGVYKCEVSGEAPLFQTVVKKGKLNVVVLPDEEVFIEGNRKHYDEGEDLVVNCTSPCSFPPAKIEWYINDVKAHPSMIRTYNTTRHLNSLFSSKVGLQLSLRKDHFHSGLLRLKCVSRISSLHRKCKEEVVYKRKQVTSSELLSAVHQYLPHSGSKSEAVHAICLAGCMLVVCAASKP